MTKELIFSPSCIKTYIGSKAKFAGTYILGIRDDNDNKDALQLGKMFEERLFTGKDNWSIIEGIDINNKEKFDEDYNTLKWNSEGMVIGKGKQQVECKGELFGEKFRGYIDNLTDDGVVEDIKTAQYLSKKDSKQINHWSGMSYYDEYALQLRLYMKMTGVKKSRIIEVSKHKYKEADRHENQIIEFELTDEFDKEMTSKYEPIIKEMKEMYEKFDFGK